MRAVHRAHSPASRRAKISLTALALGALAGAGTWAAFSATSASSANSFAAGTVALSDNDSGSAVLSLSNAVPGNSDSGCIMVATAAA